MNTDVHLCCDRESESSDPRNNIMMMTDIGDRSKRSRKVDELVSDRISEWLDRRDNTTVATNREIETYAVSEIANMIHGGAPVL